MAHDVLLYIPLIHLGRMIISHDLSHPIYVVEKTKRPDTAGLLTTELFVKCCLANLPRGALRCSRVLDLHHQNVAGSGFGKPIHYNGDLFPFDHDLDSDPAVLFQRVDCSGALSGSDLAGGFELGPLDVICAEDILLCSYWRLVPVKGTGGSMD